VASRLVAVAIVGFATCFVLSIVVERICIALGVYDMPSPRRIHPSPLPRLGGIAIFLAFLVSVAFVVRPIDHSLVWILIGALVITVVMTVDDIRGLPPLIKGCAQIVAAVFPVAGGIVIADISSPFNDPFHPSFILPPIHLPPLLATVLTIAWLFAMMNVINWIDGIDGLAAGVVAIAAMVLAVVTLIRMPGQGGISLLLVALAASSAGFLPRNWSPSKIIMGDVGAHFLGYMLGVLAILGGARLANAALVLGIPILDAAWVIVNRIQNGHNPMYFDLGHLHHRLLKAGLSQRSIVMLLYGLSTTFGMIALVLPKTQKIFGFVLLLIVATLMMTRLTRQERARQNHR